MVSPHQVAVVVDSSACLPPELVNRWRVLVVPHQLVIEDSALRDGIDITPDQFYRLLRDGGPMTTSAPTPAAFLEAFRGAAQAGQQVLCITLSANFSATYDAARAAQREAEEALPGLQVRVLDSRSAAGASGLIALAAATAAADGADLDGVAQRAEQLIPQVQLLASLGTLFYLGRSGKVARVKAWAGTVLGIKPIVELRWGEAHLVERPRSHSQAISRLVEITEERAGGQPLVVNVMEADAAQQAEELRQRVEQELCCRELLVSQFTPVMGVHTGPGLLGLAFYTEP